MNSIHPVVDPQSRNRFEFGKVAGEQGGVVGKASMGSGFAFQHS
jgi:hypothetical protein